MVFGGLGLFGGGIAVDALSPTSKDRKLDGADFIAPALEVGGAIVAGVGLLTNPFTPSESE